MPNPKVARRPGPREPLTALTCVHVPDDVSVAQIMGLLQKGSKKWLRKSKDCTPRTNPNGTKLGNDGYSPARPKG
jgi:hypothetical protein